jgi:DNA-directed RNA polymerase subunit RPC12/RpoP
MPVVTLQCPQCRHEFLSLVLDGTRPPEIWQCSKCGSEKAGPKADAPPLPHPWESSQRYRNACPCCGL